MTVGTSAKTLQSALQDMPLFGVNIVNVTQSLASDGVSIIYSCTFSADFGDVPSLQEVLNLTSVTVTEVVKGIATGNQIQLDMSNAVTNLFNPTSLTAASFFFNLF